MLVRAYYFFSSQWAILLALLVPVLLILILFCQNYVQLAFCVAVLGLAAGFYLPAGMAKLTELTPSASWGKALAVHELGPNIAFSSRISAAAFCGLFFSPAFKALALSVPPELRNQAIGFTVPLGFFLGAGVLPLLLGAMGDVGLFGLAFIVYGILLAAGSLLTRGLVPLSPRTP